MTLVDAHARAEATNPAQSYIVQAPAGSGKTEILTQRFLRLLSVVDNPEQIIALTFTRKAAQEMRERIIHAIQKAKNNHEAKSNHEAQTLMFAKAVLKRSDERQWDLVHQGNRLRIMTIDSLCQMICHAMPLQEKHLPFAELSGDPSKHYLKAAKNTIEDAFQMTEYQEAIKLLLLHQDNKMGQLIRLFRELLIQRDKWMPILLSARHYDRAYFEETLAEIEHHRLCQLQESLPKPLYAELIRLSKILADIDNQQKIDSETIRSIQEHADITLKQVKAIAKLVFNSTGGVRQQFDHHVGLKKDLCDDSTFKTIKSQSAVLLANIQEYPEFISHLDFCKSMPNPYYDDSQWDVLQAVFKMLLLLAAQLEMLFQESNEYDFTAASQMALKAMGEIDNPSDLALHMDYSIRHLLIDEFQDTSISQFELLEHLVAGWEHGDGRTLFVVGDPMQSIYRFRQAEVGLFIRAQKSGIGHVDLTPLYLQCNFRSRPQLIDWVGRYFKDIFPKKDDIESGAVHFHQATAVLPFDEDAYVKAIEFEENEDEALYILHEIKQHLHHYPNDDIAILVRSRGLLSPIINQFRFHKIEWQGSDIAKLQNLSHIVDIYSLTQLLNNPAERLPWLSLLRSPIVGLHLSEICLIAEWNVDAPFPKLLQDVELYDCLSKSAQLRLRWFWNIIKQHLDIRMQHSLAHSVLACWRDLNADLLTIADKEHDIERYLTLLEEHEQAGMIRNMVLFEEALSQLYSEDTRQANIHIMTIHKSKGLEFDTVFLPGLNQRARDSDTTLLRWLQIVENNKEMILISPMRAAEDEHAPIYDFIGHLFQEKNDFEAARLLYVAVTRAKKRLILTSSGKNNVSKTFKSMLSQVEFESFSSHEEAHEEEQNLPKVYTLPDSYFKDKGELYKKAYGQRPSLEDDIPRHFGILCHMMLEYIGSTHKFDKSAYPWHLVTQYCQLNALTEHESFFLNELNKIINNITNDSKAMWFLSKHEQEANELAVLSHQQDTYKTKVLDRTFIEDGIRWIIDYKSGHPNDEMIKAYQQQINEYAALLSKIEQLPVRCALYFLETSSWLEWAYE